MPYIGPREQRRLREEARKRLRGESKDNPIQLWNSPRWNACLHDWQRSVRPNSAETYMRVITQFFTDRKKTPDQYTQSDVRAFLSRISKLGHRKGQEISPGTKNNNLVALRSFYDFARNYDVPFRNGSRPIMLRRSPTHNIDLWEVATPDRSMTDADVRRFFAAIPRETIYDLRNRAIFLCYFWTGRRLSEILGMCWRDIEQDYTFEDGAKGVRYAWIGKGRVNQSFAELPPDAWEGIVIYLKASERWETMTPAEPLFIGHGPATLKDNPGIDRDWIEILYQRYCKAAGLVGRTGIHDWRHTCAENWWEETQNLSEVQKKLDHKSPASTLRYLRRPRLSSDQTARRLRRRYADL